MKETIVIHEKDHSDKEECIIGVASSIIKAYSMMTEYYGEGMYEVLKTIDVRDSGVEEIYELQVIGAFNEPYRTTVTYLSFTVNEI